MKTPLVVACIILFGLSTFLRKMAVDRLHPYQFQVVATSVYLAVLPFWMWMVGRVGTTTYSPSGVALTVVCTLIHITGAVMLGTLFRGSTNTGVISALCSLSPVITLGLSMLFLGEKLTVGKVFAFLFAVVSAILVNF